jgi:hypothetical protein
MSLILVKLMVESFIEHINVTFKIIYFLVILTGMEKKLMHKLKKTKSSSDGHFIFQNTSCIFILFNVLFKSKEEVF